MKRFLPFTIFLILIAGCSIVGIHFKIHNPNRAGKFPKKTEALVLLGNQDTRFRTCYDVKYYNLTVSFGADLKENHSINGAVTVVAKANNDFDTLQIDLAENLKLKEISFNLIKFPGMPSDAITVSGINNYRKGNAVFIIMPHRLKMNEVFSLQIFYSGTPSEAKKAPWSGGFIRKEDDLKKPWWGVACQTEGASSWWPCKDVMNDEPDSVDLYYEVSGDLKAIGNGKLISESSYFPRGGWVPDISKKRTIFHWHVSNPINIYNITFYIGNYKLIHDTYYSEITHDTLQLNHYVVEQNYEKAKTHFQQLKKYLAFYEETFGPYPWYRDGFKLVESPYAGMEHQSAIAYGNVYKNDPVSGFDYIILHETAHEWWGNSVTANDLSQSWIHEGFATYAEALYVEKTKGYDAYEKYLLNYRLFIINRRPLIGEKGIRYFNYKDSDIYVKGAWVLHSLRHVIGNDSLFFDILHLFYMENRVSEISSEKLEELVNRKTGKDFHWFFEQYLYNRFVPELEYCETDGKLFYRWNKTKNNFLVNVNYVQQANGFDEKVGFAATILPSFEIQSADLRNSKIEVKFKDNEFLFKPVENKSLVKEAQKSGIGKF
ncbi:MAG: M1 family metallopeptidase [Bacteroidota bacterium]|nr:M1 family metallopeptidase [Bacteroidota bacterium]